MRARAVDLVMRCRVNKRRHYRPFPLYIMYIIVISERELLAVCEHFQPNLYCVVLYCASVRGMPLLCSLLHHLAQLRFVGFLKQLPNPFSGPVKPAKQDRCSELPSQTKKWRCLVRLKKKVTCLNEAGNMTAFFLCNYTVYH